MELGPDQSGLDRLAEADLVSDQEPLRVGLQQLEQRFELVGTEHGARRPIGVDDIGQWSAQLGCRDE